MTDPDRLEKALPNLLQRSGWTGPDAPPLTEVPLEEQNRWEQLFEEPAEPVRRRFGAGGLLGATGLVAAALIAAVSFRNVLQSSSQLKTVPSETATQKPIDKALTAARPKVEKQKPSEFSVPPEKIRQQPLLPTQPAPKTSTSLGRSAPEPTSAASPPSNNQKNRETAPKKSVDAVQDNLDVSGKRRADEEDSIASRAETKKDGSQFTGKLEDKTATSQPSFGVLPKSAAPIAPAPAVSSASQPTSRLSLVSASGLDAITRERFQQQLTKTQLQSTTAGEVVFDLKAQEGRVSEATFIENSSSLKDANIVETLKKTLQEVSLPPTANFQTRVTVRVE
jgi:hypothetical protein